MGGSVYLGCDHRGSATSAAATPVVFWAGRAATSSISPSLRPSARGLVALSNLTSGCGTVTGITHAEPGAVVDHRAEDGTVKRAHGRFVLACDGASSAIRKALGLKARRPEVRGALAGHGRLRPWPDALARGYGIPEEVRDGRCSLMVCDPERPATLIPGAGEHRRWEHMLLPHERDADMVKDAAIHALIDKWVDPADVEIVRATSTASTAWSPAAGVTATSSCSGMRPTRPRPSSARACAMACATPPSWSGSCTSWWPMAWPTKPCSTATRPSATATCGPSSPPPSPPARPSASSTRKRRRRPATPTSAPRKPQRPGRPWP